MPGGKPKDSRSIRTGHWVASDEPHLPSRPLSCEWSSAHLECAVGCPVLGAEGRSVLMRGMQPCAPRRQANLKSNEKTLRVGSLVNSFAVFCKQEECLRLAISTLMLWVRYSVIG